MKQFGYGCILTALFVGLGATPPLSARLAITEVGGFSFLDTGVSELGGLSWVSDDPDGEIYYAVFDDEPVLIPLTIDLNPRGPKEEPE